MKIQDLQNLIVLSRRGLSTSLTNMPVEEAEIALASIKAGETFVQGLINAQQAQQTVQPQVQGPVEVVDINPEK